MPAGAVVVHLFVMGTPALDDVKEARVLKGKSYSLGGHGGSGDRFIDTTEAIATYVASKYGTAMKRLVLRGKVKTFLEPPYPANPTDELKTRWTVEWNAYNKKKEKYDEHRDLVFSLIFERCDERDLRNQVLSHESFDKLEDDANVPGLLSLI